MQALGKGHIFQINIRYPSVRLCPVGLVHTHFLKTCLLYRGRGSRRARARSTRSARRRRERCTRRTSWRECTGRTRHTRALHRLHGLYPGRRFNDAIINNHVDVPTIGDEVHDFADMNVFKFYAYRRFQRLFYGTLFILLLAHFLDFGHRKLEWFDAARVGPFRKLLGRFNEVTDHCPVFGHPFLGSGNGLLVGTDGCLMQTFLRFSVFRVN